MRRHGIDENLVYVWLAAAPTPGDVGAAPFSSDVFFVPKN